MKKIDTQVHNDIMKMYMADEQYARVSEAENKESEELSDRDYYALKCKLY